MPDNTVYEHKGLVDFAAPQVNPKTGTFSVRAELANPDHVLLPGQFTKVKVLLDVRENATVVPQKALIIEKEELISLSCEKTLPWKDDSLS